MNIKGIACQKIGGIAFLLSECDSVFNGLGILFFVKTNFYVYGNQYITESSLVNDLMSHRVTCV